MADDPSSQRKLPPDTRLKSLLGTWQRRAEEDSGNQTDDEYSQSLKECQEQYQFELVDVYFLTLRRVSRSREALSTEQLLDLVGPYVRTTCNFVHEENLALILDALQEVILVSATYFRFEGRLDPAYEYLTADLGAPRNLAFRSHLKDLFNLIQKMDTAPPLHTLERSDTDALLAPEFESMPEHAAAATALFWEEALPGLRIPRFVFSNAHLETRHVTRASGSLWSCFPPKTLFANPIFYRKDLL